MALCSTANNRSVPVGVPGASSVGHGRSLGISARAPARRVVSDAGELADSPDVWAAASGCASGWLLQRGQVPPQAQRALARATTAAAGVDCAGLRKRSGIAALRMGGLLAGADRTARARGAKLPVDETTAVIQPGPHGLGSIARKKSSLAKPAAKLSGVLQMIAHCPGPGIRRPAYCGSGR